MIDWNKTYCGNNENVMTEFAAQDVQFDLVCTDPPYCVGKDFGNDSDRQDAEHFLHDMELRINLMDKLMSPTSSNLILFASHLYVHDIRFMLEKKLAYQRMLIWHYKNGMSRQVNSPVTEYEPFLWFSRSTKNFIYNADDVRVPYKSDRVKTPVYKKNKDGTVKAWTPNPLGAKRGDVWEYPCLAGKLYEDERTEHPTQKPESLMTDLLKAFCPKGVDGKYEGRVLDPFHGSGTVGACCERLNAAGHRIQWIGIELEQRWVDVADKRVSDVRAKADEYIM